MTLRKIYDIIKKFIINKYNRLIVYIKNRQINKQTDQESNNQDVHVIKAKVKSIKVKK